MVKPYTAGKRILSQWNDPHLDAAWQEQKLNCTGYVRSSNEGVLNWASLLRACYQMSTGSLCWPGWKHQVIFENIKLPINAPNTSSSWLHSIMFFTLGDQGSACNIRCDMSSCVSYFFLVCSTYFQSGKLPRAGQISKSTPPQSLGRHHFAQGCKFTVWQQAKIRAHVLTRYDVLISHTL